MLIQFVSFYRLLQIVVQPLLFLRISATHLQARFGSTFQRPYSSSQVHGSPLDLFGAAKLPQSPGRTMTCASIEIHIFNPKIITRPFPPFAKVLFSKALSGMGQIGVSTWPKPSCKWSMRAQWKFRWNSEKRKGFLKGYTKDTGTALLRALPPRGH